MKAPTTKLQDPGKHQAPVFFASLDIRSDCEGRARCPQAGGAGTKGARPLGCRNVRKSQARRQIRRRAAVRDLCSLKAALLSGRENLRKKTTISDIVIQRAASPFVFSTERGHSCPQQFPNASPELCGGERVRIR